MYDCSVLYVSMVLQRFPRWRPDTSFCNDLRIWRLFLHMFGATLALTPGVGIHRGVQMYYMSVGMMMIMIKKVLAQAKQLFWASRTNDIRRHGFPVILR